MTTFFEPLPLTLALDAPARAALTLAKRPAWNGLGWALGGATLVALACWAAATLVFLDHRALLGGGRLVSSFFEAVALVLPSAVVFATYLGLGLTPRVWIASISVAILTAGVVTTLLVPAFAYLALVTRTAPVLALALVPPFVALATVGAILARVLSSLDSSRTAQMFRLGLQLALLGAFAARAWPSVDGWQGLFGF